MLCYEANSQSDVCANTTLRYEGVILNHLIFVRDGAVTVFYCLNILRTAWGIPFQQFSNSLQLKHRNYHKEILLTK